MQNKAKWKSISNVPIKQNIINNIYIGECNIKQFSRSLMATLYIIALEIY